MRALRAQRSQLAPKIGHESDPPVTYVQPGGNHAAGGADYNNNNNRYAIPPQLGGDQRSGVYSSGAYAAPKPTTPPGERRLFPPIDRYDNYYDANRPPLPSPADALAAQRQAPPPAAYDPPSPNRAGADGPRYGRRARTVETDDRDRSRQERLAQYQRELKEQMEAEVARKKEEAARWKAQEREMDDRIHRENEERARREKADMMRERQDLEEKQAAAMGGRRAAKRDPNVSVQADDGAKFGRRAGNNEQNRDKEQEYRAELQRQADETRKRKEAEAARLKAEEEDHDRRMQAWAESEGPLGQNGGGGGGGRGARQAVPMLPNIAAAPNQQAYNNNYQGGGGGGYDVRSSQEQVINSAEFGGGQLSGRPYDPNNGQAGMPYNAQPAPYGGMMQQPGHGFNQPPMPPQPSYGYQASSYYGHAAMVPAGTTEVSQLRDEIMQLLHHQSRQIDDLAYRQPLPAQVMQPLLIPGPLVAPPPAHRGYGAQMAAQPAGPASAFVGPGIGTRRTMAAMGDAQYMLDRFLQEDETRRDESLFHGVHPLVIPTAGAGAGALQAPPPQDMRGSVQLSFESKFVPKDDYMNSNIELDSEPAQFIMPTHSARGH